MLKKRVEDDLHLTIEDDCDCPQCRMRDAIFAAAADDVDDGIVSFDPAVAALDLVPTLGIIASHLSQDMVEKWMNLIIDARLRAMDPRSDEMPEIKGRA